MISSTESKIPRFLHGVHGRLMGLRRARKVYEPLLAMAFNPIELLSPYENDLSRLLADLLSPYGNHGQGPLFLQAFIDRFELKGAWLETSTVRVSTEAQTFNGRRIDIKLSFGKSDALLLRGEIGIENKPTAMDQKNQVADYIEDIKRRNGENHFLIYLSGSGNGPTENSTAGLDFPSLRVVSYVDLSAWLKDCALQTQSIRVKFFIEEFISYINKKFGGVQDMGEQEIIVTEVFQSAESLDAAWAVFASIPDVKNRLLEKMSKEFQVLAKVRYPTWIIDVDLKSAQYSKYKGISVHFAVGDSYRVRFAFEQNGCNQLLFGVCKSTESATARTELHDLIQGIAGSGEQSLYWPWYKSYEPLNWEMDGVAWLQIQSGEMAQRMLKDVSEIYEGLKQAGILDRLG